MNDSSSGKKRLFTISTISGIFYAIIVVFGRQIYLYSNFTNLFSSISATAVTLLSLVFITVFISILLYFLFTRFLTISADGAGFQQRVICGKIKNSNFITWAINLIVIFVCWLPCYLAYYPGVLTYDIPAQINILAGLFLATTHQPPVHTMIFGWCLN